ncbi:MAG: DUF2029 domain-containing protein [Chloroflexi bacterium]|nr:DUF2029 domain-containing protein [Chloroflexota bacterium]
MIQAGSRSPSVWRYVAGNGAALLLGLTAAYLALLHGHSITSATIKTGDFLAYYSGAFLVAHGQGVHLYSFGTLGRLQSALLAPLPLRQSILMPYLYPPYLALVMAPLGRLPYSAAYALWLTINALLLVLAMSALEAHSGLSGRVAVRIRLLALCSLPVLFTLFNGQTSILILALLTLSFAAALRGRDGWAGAALAAATIKLPYILPLLLIFLLRRRWRALLSFAAASLALLLAPLPLLGLRIDADYLHTLLQAAGWHNQFGYEAARNNSFAGFTELLLPSPAASIARVILCLAALAALAWCAKGTHKGCPYASIDLPFGLGVVVALLVNPHVLVHDLTLLLIPAAIALGRRTAGRPRGMHRRILASILIATYLAVTLGYWLAFAIPIQLSVLGMSMLGIWLCAASARPASLEPRLNPGPAVVPGHALRVPLRRRSTTARDGIR